MTEKYRYTFDSRGRVLDVTDTESGKRVLAMRYDATRQDAGDQFRQEDADGTTAPPSSARRVFHSAAQIRDYLSLPPAIQPPASRPAPPMRQDAGKPAKPQPPRVITSSAELRRAMGYRSR